MFVLLCELNLRTIGNIQHLINEKILILNSIDKEIIHFYKQTFINFNKTIILNFNPFILDISEQLLILYYIKFVLFIILLLFIKIYYFFVDRIEKELNLFIPNIVSKCESLFKNHRSF